MWLRRSHTRKRITCHAEKGKRISITVRPVLGEGVELLGPHDEVWRLSPQQIGQLRAELRDGVFAAFPHPTPSR